MLNERNITGPIEDLKESLFLDRYHRLLSWAMRLTNYDRSSAEDLVHDAFIQFTRGRTSCDTILNIDGYLRRMLRYLHLARVSCHTEQLDKQSLSIADYDSLSLGLRACDIDRHLQAKEQLFEICRYACIRKETSRAGSVLILRFFYEYTPSEIAKLLGRPRHSVDEWQRVARKELKIYLDNPRQLTFVRINSPAHVNVCDAFIRQTDLSTALRRMVFSSRLGDCLAVDELKDIYVSGNLEKLTPGRLAHIVSCWRCLDTTNHFLGLPTLSERFDVDEDDRIEPPNDKNGSGGTSNDLRRRITRHLREVIEHKPHQLCVRVNGVPASSFSVDSGGGEFYLNISHPQDDSFIDVSSEQGVILLLLETQAQFESWGQIDLSEGRLLEASFSGNTLSVIYHAPELHAASKREPLRLLQPQTDELSVVAENTFWQRLKSIFKIQEFLRPAWLIPACVTLLIAILLLTALIKRTPPTITASTLLQRAAVAEQRRNSVAGHVIHRVITLEERQPTEGTVISRQRIEMWQDLTNGSRAERIFDDHNRLLAERLESPTNGSTVFHHKPNGSLPLNAEDTFRLQPTAGTFAMLIGVNPVLVMEQRPGLYVISYSGNSTTPIGQLLKATLTLSEDDLRAIEETLLVEHLGQIREYRFIEIRFDQIAREELDSAVFQPTPEKKPTATVSTISTGHNPSASEPRNTTVASTELEIEAAYLLDKAKADRGEQIALSRETNGSLRIEGVVETGARKEELLQSLNPLINNPSISINIQAADTGSRDLTKQAEWTTLQPSNSTLDRIAVDREVREYLLRTRTLSSTTGADPDEVLNTFASKTVNRSYRALFHAVQLKQLVDRFSDVKMRTMSAESRDKLHTIIRTHAEALGREYASLTNELAPIFHSSISSDLRERQHIDNDEQLITAVQKLSRLVRTINDAIRSAFTISAQGSSVGIKSEQFWKDLTDAEQVAVRISNF